MMFGLMLALGACADGEVTAPAQSVAATTATAAPELPPLTPDEELWIAALSDGSCGDGACAPPEDCNSCPSDCGGCCGNHKCEPPEDCKSCPGDCGDCCGDYKCEAPEDCNSCPGDCGPCQ
jgi:hypothetical protein